MRGSRSALLTGTIATLCLAGNAGLSRSSQPSGSEIQNNRVSRIIGRTVQDRNAEDLGVVKDFVVDTQSGQVKYAIVSSRGLFGIGARSKAVPSHALSTATAKRNTVAISISQARWEKAPLFDGKLAALSDEKRALQLDEHYGKPLPKGELAQRSPTPGTQAALPPTGREAGESGRAQDARTGLQLASDMIGKDIVNRQQEDIGEVSDLLVDLVERKPALAIIAAGKLLQDNKSFAVPLRLLSLTASNKLLLDANRKLFEQAPPFDAKAWQAGPRSIDAVYRYPDGEPDNTRRNARDRSEGGLTPFAQSGTAADRRLTRQLRAAVIKDEGLSLTAKNIKIITINGKVTLRGPVHKEQERAQIERRAVKIAGEHNLVNQLEVKNN